MTRPKGIPVTETLYGCSVTGILDSFAAFSGGSNIYAFYIWPCAAKTAGILHRETPAVTDYHKHAIL